MKILGIETSCDETAAAVVEDGTKILSNFIASSQEIHIKTGGIIPEIAAREQIRCILPIANVAISNFKFQISNLDAIAVTVGPGLIGSLLVGVETAKTLAYLWHKPIIPVNHLLAHVYANWLKPREREGKKIPNSPYSLNTPTFPLIALIVSGGHTELIFMKDHGKYQWLSGTRDDAAGECFDKCARLLGLGYPGGPAIAAAAEKYKVEGVKYKAKLPRPMIDSDDFDFSFSGLKTAVFREIQKLKKHQQFNNLAIQQLAQETQEAITDVLVEKTFRAAKIYKVKSLLLAGGVAANSRFREKILNTSYLIPKTKFFVPTKNLCTDNAAMVAAHAFFNFKPLPWLKIQALPSLEL